MRSRTTGPLSPADPEAGSRAAGWRGTLHAGLSVLTAVLEALGAVILAALLALVMAAVVTRYLFGGGLFGAEEGAVWLHLALIAAGAPLAASGALSFRLDLLSRALPPRGRRVSSLAADAVAIVGALVLLRGGAAVAEFVGGRSTLLGLPEGWRYGLFAAAGGLTLAILLVRAALDRGPAEALGTAALGLGLYALCQGAPVASVEPPSLVAAAVALAGLALGTPLPLAFLAAAAAAIPAGGLLPEPAVVQTTVAGASKVLLLAIPFFLLAGELLVQGGLAERLVRFAASLVGHRRAGLAQTALLSGVLFSGASGSSVANAAFGARVMAPALVRAGHPPAEAAAIVAAVSVLDNIIPPSIAFLILAAATNLSVGALLIGGAVAGAVLALALAIALHLGAGRTTESKPRVAWPERGSLFVRALPALGLGAVVVAGIRAGLVTTTEAAALAAAYALAAGLATRGLTPRGLWRALTRTAVDAAAIGLLIGATAPLAFLFAVDRLSDQVAGLATLLGGGPFAVMLLANLILLAVGLVLDIGAAILLLAPLLLPVAVAAGLDPIHFGVVLVVNLMIHGLTPPLGILVYVVAGITRTPAAAVFRAVLPLLGALLAALAVLALAAAAWPSLQGALP